MKRISLTNGGYALVDNEDFDFLNQWKWHSEKARYAVRKEYVCKKPDGKWETRWVRLHRLVMNAPADMEVDHINGDGLDNRKDNLRICTHRQNSVNTKLRSDNRSGYKGVGWHPQIKRWRARIVVNGKKIHLGTFLTPEEAFACYSNAALTYHQDFANLARKRG